MTPVDEVICIGKGVDASQVPFGTIYGSYRLTRMSPLVVRLPEPAHAAQGMVTDSLHATGQN